MLTVFLSVALSVNSLSYQELETYYWDCDTKYMLQTMSGQDYNSCISITEEFQKHFFGRAVFIKYWNANKQKQWAIRGYKPLDNKAE